MRSHDQIDQIESGNIQRSDVLTGAVGAASVVGAVALALNGVPVVVSIAVLGIGTAVQRSVESSHSDSDQ